jgi:hypothetical protein
MPIRRVSFAVLATTAALAVAAPAAGAITIPTWPSGSAAAGLTVPGGGNIAIASGACGGTSTAGQGQNNTGGTTSLHCLGSGVSYTGPAIGQIATVVGPKIVSPAVVGASIVVVAGNGVAGP